jgi:hypothetical protein
MMEMQMALAGNSDPEDTETAAERAAAREESNREWRRRREARRWASCGLEPPPSPATERERHRLAARGLESELLGLLLCSACREQLGPEAWQCGEGHFTCGLCCDERNLGCDVREDSLEAEERMSVVAALRRSLSSTATLRSRRPSLASVGTVASIATVAAIREELATMAEEDEDRASDQHKSFSKYQIDEIDFFLDTIEVRKDAISCYGDYNNAGRTIFYDPDIEALQRESGEVSAVPEESHLFQDERSARVLQYMDRLRRKGSVASIRETLIDIVQTAEEETDPSWAKFRLEELDFFLDTIDIRKDAIGYYGDYHNNFKSIFEHNFKNSKGSLCSGSTSTTSSAPGRRITRCTTCSGFLLSRNQQVERIAQIFFDV